MGKKVGKKLRDCYWAREVAKEHIRKILKPKTLLYVEVLEVKHERDNWVVVGQVVMDIREFGIFSSRWDSPEEVKEDKRIRAVPFKLRFRDNEEGTLRWYKIAEHCLDRWEVFLK